MLSCQVWGFDTVVLSIIGVLTLINIFSQTVWNFLQLAHAYLAPYLLNEEPQTLTSKYGSWALITGSTDGIGKAYAKELAKRGINIVLVSRTQEKLLNTAREIENEFSVKTKIIPVDFASGRKAIETIKEELKSTPPIGILVNNVGKQYPYPMYLGEVPTEELWDIININIGAVTLMTRILIEEMKSHGRGAIVNVSSASECQPLPLMNVYAASKVYIKHFTEALREEYRNSGITIQHLSPFFINTKMNNFSNRLRTNSFFIPDAQTYAKHAVNTLGKLDCSTGYWRHGVQHFITTVPPVWIRMKFGSLINKSLRKEYFKLKNIQKTALKDQST